MMAAEPFGGAGKRGSSYQMKETMRKLLYKR